jgi:hypothetical protein
MKTRGLLVTIFAVALGCAPLFVNTSSAASAGYSAQLNSPTAEQVLYPGQQVRVEWKRTLPSIPLRGCESELGCRWMAAVRFPCGLRSSPRAVHLSSGLFRTRLPTRRFSIFASDVTCITPKATLPSLHRCSPSRSVQCRRAKFCS